MSGLRGALCLILVGSTSRVVREYYAEGCFSPIFGVVGNIFPHGGRAFWTGNHRKFVRNFITKGDPYFMRKY